MSAETQPKVLLILGQGFEDFEAAAIIDACGWTGYHKDLPAVKVRTTGFGATVRGRFGLVIAPDIPLGEVEIAEYDALVLPGGFHAHGYDEVFDERLYALLREAHDSGILILAMCVGALVIGEAGLLRGKRATTYPYSRRDNVARLRELGAVVSEEPVVVDDGLISCRAPVQALEAAMLMLRELLGAEAVAHVRRCMGLE
jgi:4-methyl-5(b-hydroxyethyl)-thiazole monophosphate biosynthesis